MSNQRGYSEDEEDDRRRTEEEEDDDDRSQTLSVDEEEESKPGSAQQRKREALFPAISSICQALGGYEEFKTANGEIVSEYSLGDSVVACLKDLKRFWRMDERDPDRTVSRIFFEVGVLKNDLVPILLSTLGTSPKGDRIALACVELMGAMTWPIDVAEELRDAKILDELRKSSDYTSLITAQMSYKATILRTGSLAAMFQLMSPCLTKTRRERSKKDENIISLILHTFRNLAALKDRVTASHSADAVEESTLQSELIKQMSSEYIFELLISIAHNADSSEFSDWNMVTLDILHLIFRGVKATDLMIPEGKLDKINDDRLNDLLDLEYKEKKAASRRTNSRHSRFGTTVALKSNGHQYILHKQSSLIAGAESTMDAIKKGKARKIREDDDLAPPSNLRSDAIKCLRDVAISFIDSAFNPFFSSVLKDIRMERLKVKESDTIRFLFLSRFFLEFFLLLYTDEKKRGIDPENDENGHGFDLIAEMTEPQCIGFVTQRMNVGLDEKPPLWIELHAGVDCFIQILLVIDALAASGVQENVDVAEILQNKLYYEAETLEMVINVIVKYTNQSLKYLDSVIHLSYVLLRMLEKYSKSKAYMYVRKKKSRGKKRAKKIDENAEDGMGIGDDEEEEEMERGTLNYGEHAFEFSKFEQKFAEESVLQTCMVYLEGYKSFSDPEQMKRIVSLMHRQAVKTNSEALFFKPSVLQLFQKILTDDTLFHVKGGAAAADLKKLIEYILKKFFKAVKDSPFVCLEIFFPKTRNQLGKLRDGIEDPYASSEEDTFFKAGNGEVEVQPGFSLSQQIGIAVASLVDDDRLSLVELVQSQLHLASLARKELVLTTDGQLNPDPLDILDIEMIEPESDSEESIRKKAAKLAGPSKEALDLFRPHTIPFESDEEKKSASGNGPFKLLMRLLKWESAALIDSTELVWAIPTSLIPSVLDGDIKLIENFLLDPVDPNGKSAADLLRKKRKAPTRKRKMLPSDVENSGGEIVPATKKVKKRKEEMEAYKSAQFIEDSDDEENAEKDALFFAAEAALRASLATGAVTAAAVAGHGKKKKDKTTSNSTAAAAAKKSKSKSKSKAQVKLKEAPKKSKTLNSLDEMSDTSDGEDFSLLRQAAREQKEEGSNGNGGSVNGGKSDRSSSVPRSDAMAEEEHVVEEESEEEGEEVPRKKRLVIVDSDDE